MKFKKADLGRLVPKIVTENVQARHQFRRSAVSNQSPVASVQIQEASKPSHADYQKVYIMKVEPAEVVFSQDEQVKFRNKRKRFF